MNEITIYKKIKKIVYNQNFQQKINMFMIIFLEIYRVMISSLLIVFVPQSCDTDKHICSMMENVKDHDLKTSIGLLLNYLTMLSFIILYICEIRREEKLIKILEVNNKTSSDSESVGKRFDILDVNKKNLLLKIDKNYKYVTYYVICIYVLNTIVSGVIINEHSLDYHTKIVFMTNILFMITKLYNVITIVNTEKNIFLSAYLNTKVQYNDIDPYEIKKIEICRLIELKKIIEHLKSSGELIENNNEIYLIKNNEIRIMEEGGFEIL